MNRVIISGIGTEIPQATISNDELVESFNMWVEWENIARRANGKPLLEPSDSEFVVYASGVKARHVYERDGILDPDRMTPNIPARADGELSVMAEFGLAAARRALAAAGADGKDIDLVICSASHLQRPYPSIAIEIQREIGAGGMAFDMGLGCSSAAAALHTAASFIKSGAHKRILVVTPELVTGHLNFRDRQTHFIFGDAAVAMVVEAHHEGAQGFEVLATSGWTQFSNNIRTNFGFLNRAAQDDPSSVSMDGNMIKQVGNKVFKEVTIAASHFIKEFLAANGTSPDALRRYWLHQANARMNAMIMKLALGHEANADLAPMVLDRLGNTAAAGAVIALSENSADMRRGEAGLFCAFGAGYSIGAALLKKL